MIDRCEIDQSLGIHVQNTLPNAPTNDPLTHVTQAKLQGKGGGRLRDSCCRGKSVIEITTAADMSSERGESTCVHKETHREQRGWVGHHLSAGLLTPVSNRCSPCPNERTNFRLFNSTLFVHTI